MERVDEIEFYLMLDGHEKVSLSVMEFKKDTHYVQDLPREDLRIYKHVAIHAVIRERKAK